MSIPDSHLAGMTDAELIREAINADPLTRILAERLEERVEWSEPLAQLLEDENYDCSVEGLKPDLIRLHKLEDAEEARREAVEALEAALLLLKKEDPA